MKNKRYLIHSNWEVVSGVHVFPSVEHRFLSSEYFGISLHHCLDNLPVDLPRTLVGCYSDVVVVEVSPRHCYLEVIGPQCYQTTVCSNVRPSRTHEQNGRHILQSGRTGGSGRSHHCAHRGTNRGLLSGSHLRRHRRHTSRAGRSRSYIYTNKTFDIYLI